MKRAVSKRAWAIELLNLSTADRWAIAGIYWFHQARVGSHRRTAEWPLLFRTRQAARDAVRSMHTRTKIVRVEMIIKPVSQEHP